MHQATTRQGQHAHDMPNFSGHKHQHHQCALPLRVCPTGAMCVLLAARTDLAGWPTSWSRRMSTSSYEACIADDWPSELEVERSSGGISLGPVAHLQRGPPFRRASAPSSTTILINTLSRNSSWIAASNGETFWRVLSITGCHTDRQRLAISLV